MTSSPVQQIKPGVLPLLAGDEGFDDDRLVDKVILARVPTKGPWSQTLCAASFLLSSYGATRMTGPSRL